MGPIGDAVAGALIGSVVPVIGTLGGAIGGYVFGYFRTKAKLEEQHAYEIAKIKAQHPAPIANAP